MIYIVTFIGVGVALYIVLTLAEKLADKHTGWGE